jgi:hypothetical protein
MLPIKSGDLVPLSWSVLAPSFPGILLAMRLEENKWSLAHVDLLL